MIDYISGKDVQADSVQECKHDAPAAVDASGLESKLEFPNAMKPFTLDSKITAEQQQEQQLAAARVAGLNDEQTRAFVLMTNPLFATIRGEIKSDSKADKQIGRA